VREHLATDECVDAALFKERHLFGVADVTVGFVLHYAAPAVDGRLEEAVKRTRLGLAGPVDLLDDGRRGLIPLAGLLERLDLLGAVGAVRVDALEP